ncbi:MAG: hemerythrin domain-containing protein [Verrucomicrobia bacterium]|nr:hemerythrin domain-containing protein [Verrucomicrobiota bacterium]
MTIIQALAAEHVVFHNVFDHLQERAPRLKTLAEIKALSALLEMLLERHAAVEDQLLVEPLEPTLLQLGQGENFHDEHDEIDRHLHAVQHARQVSAARESLLKAVAASRRHFDREERIIFPLAKRLLKSRTLEELGRRWQEQTATRPE